MMTSFIAPNSTLRVPYTFPPGFVTIRVIAQDPVRVYVVDADGLAAYTGGTPFTSYGGSPASHEARRDYALSLTLPPRAQWFLLIANPWQDRHVNASYDAAIGSPQPLPTGSFQRT
jgi:hypothetical protein